MCKRLNKSTRIRSSNGYETGRTRQSTASTRYKVETYRDNSRENRENSFFEQRIERHRDALKDLVSVEDSSKRTVEGLKITNGDDIEGITAWGEKIENTIGEADIDLDRLQKSITKSKEHTTAKSRKDQLDFEKELYETKLHYKAQLEKMSEETEQQQNGGETSCSMSSSGLEAKLPKLAITKFNGTCKDWQQFWNQFRGTIVSKIRST